MNHHLHAALAREHGNELRRVAAEARRVRRAHTGRPDARRRSFARALVRLLGLVRGLS